MCILTPNKIEVPLFFLGKLGTTHHQDSMGVQTAKFKSLWKIDTLID